MNWTGVIGLEETKQQLQEMVQQNRLSHALLFLGKEGSGALPLALAFAQNIVAIPQKETPVLAADLFGGFSAMEHALPATATAAFNEQAFERAIQLLHPDLHFSYPVITQKTGQKPISVDFIQDWRNFVKAQPYGNVYDWLQYIKAENKQGNITAEECNDIIKKLSLKSFESRWKVLVMWMPEYLGNAGNKLLKLIEEPPADTLFILVAENEEQILPTILSRCQLVKIPRLTEAAIQAALVQQHQLDLTIAQQIAQMAQGNYREAQHLIEHAGEDWQNLLAGWLKTIVRNLPVEQVKWVEEMAKLGREKQKQFLRHFNHLLQQALHQRIAPQAYPMNEAERDFAQRLNKIASVSQQQAIIEQIDQAAYYIERNANAKMLFQALSIKLSLIINHKLVPSV
jgi:DNA polymerase III subunit delta'